MGQEPEAGALETPEGVVGRLGGKLSLIPVLPAPRELRGGIRNPWLPKSGSCVHRMSILVSDKQPIQNKNGHVKQQRLTKA